MEPQIAPIQLPVKGTLYKHQKDAVEFVCRTFGLIPEEGGSYGEGQCDMFTVRKDLSQSKN